MLIAVYIPAGAILYHALRTPTARRVIDLGWGLYTNGAHTALLPQGRPGWFRMAVTVRDLDHDTEAA